MSSQTKRASLIREAWLVLFALVTLFISSAPLTKASPIAAFAPAPLSLNRLYGGNTEGLLEQPHDLDHEEEEEEEEEEGPEILEELLHQYMLLKTPRGYVLAYKNNDHDNEEEDEEDSEDETDPQAATLRQMLRDRRMSAHSAENNFQLRVRKSFPSSLQSDSNFQLRVRRDLLQRLRNSRTHPITSSGVSSAENNFQLRVRRGRPSRLTSDNNFQLRVRKRSNDGSINSRVVDALNKAENDLQINMRRNLLQQLRAIRRQQRDSSDEDNFQLRMRRRPSADDNFQLRVRKAMPMSYDNNFQLRVRKAPAMSDNNFQLRVRRSPESQEENQIVDGEKNENVEQVNA